MEKFKQVSKMKGNGFYFSYNVDKENIEYGISKILFQILKNKKDIVIVSLGVDTVIGDCLGPLVGSMLKRNGIKNVYGTLDKTVNMSNISKILNEIHEKFNEPYILVVDAAISSEDNVNNIILKNGGFEPGIKSNNGKRVSIGDLSLVGVVWREDYKRYNLLTLLEQCDFEDVLRLARAISKILILTFLRLKKEGLYYGF
ncbi:spore protease YyaC [Clostridium felsineum]|uniref:Uncharacterized protein n=1 Tax=Clostridium felsineum TaxID=36839 RepID=A0A1S8M8E0_9CLOT|nr:spore protease YyaC [Clostridium felsineum]URZ06711.1 hypothetical protein CLROS_020440 [Clostridium felsineum]URZ11744.1 hypothetical protein CROST_024610 [Clostridium felsineum]